LRAAEDGHERVVQLLLAHESIDANSKDYYHIQTPLSRAAENGHERVVQLLTQYTSDS
jgi:ankyrin repeat protein